MADFHDAMTYHTDAETQIGKLIETEWGSEQNEAIARAGAAIASAVLALSVRMDYLTWEMRRNS